MRDSVGSDAAAEGSRAQPEQRGVLGAGEREIVLGADERDLGRALLVVLGALV